MSAPPSRSPSRAAAGLLALFAGLAGWGLLDNSLTPDEPVYLGGGYAAWTRGEFGLEVRNPPLNRLICALPYLALRPDLPDTPPGQFRLSYPLGLQFLFHNRYPAETLIRLGRLPILLAGLALLLLVWRWSASLWGEPGGLLSLALAAFCPNLIAHSGLATTDLLLCLTVVAAFFLLTKAASDPAPWRWALAGAALGAAVATKYIAVFLLPVAAWLMWDGRTGTMGVRAVGARAQPKASAPQSELLASVPGNPWPRVAGLLTTAVLVVVLSYGVTHIGLFFEGFRQTVGSAAQGQDQFLFGRYSRDGWWWYFLAAGLMKTPIPTLALLVAVCAVWVRWRGWVNPEQWPLLIPAAVIFLVASASRQQLGLRYILPVYPLLFIWAGQAAAWPFWPTRAGRVTAVLGCLWLLAGTLRAAPHHLAYFNEVAGGARGGSRFLVDANLDWGQDLKGLKRYLDAIGPHDLILSYFGSADPADYGIRHQSLLPVSPEYFQAAATPGAPALATTGETHRHAAPRELLAVSATNLRGVYYTDRTVFDWLRSRAPLAVIGGSISVYDITRDRAAHERLVALYRMQGSESEAAAEADWLKRL